MKILTVCFPLMFLPAVSLSDDEAFISMGEGCSYPVVATAEKRIYLAWLVKEKRPESVYFQRSPDEGMAWTDARRISEENGDCTPPAIGVDSGIVHIAWVDCGEVIDGELHYTRSTDEGDTWEKNRVLVGNVANANNPVLHCAGNNLYIIWQDAGQRVFFKASRDKGHTWEKEVLLGEVGRHACYCYPPALSVAGNELLVVWNDLGEKKKGRKAGLFRLWLFKADTSKLVSSVACRKSSDGGRTWSKAIVLTSAEVARESTDEVDNPTLFSDGNRSYLFWEDKHGIPLGEILYAVFDPGEKKGRISLTGKTLYPTPKRSPACPSAVFGSDGNLHLTWQSSFRGESVIHYGAIDTEGDILKKKIDITVTPGRFRNPVLARTSSGLLHLFWFSRPEDRMEPSFVFLKTSSDNGLTWRSCGSSWEKRQ